MILKPYTPGADIFSGHHSVVTGKTRHGKTYFVQKRLQTLKKPVLFFNPQRVPAPGMTTATSKNTEEQIIALLKKGGKVNYLPDIDNARASMELVYLIRALFDAGFTESRNIVLALDEIHLTRRSKPGEEAIENLATRGITFGLSAVFISQRPAYMSKAAYTMAEKHYLFLTGMERQYFTGKGIPYDDYLQRIQKGGKYSYVVFDGITLSGPYKEA